MNLPETLPVTKPVMLHPSSKITAVVQVRFFQGLMGVSRMIPSAAGEWTR